MESGSSHAGVEEANLQEDQVVGPSDHQGPHLVWVMMDFQADVCTSATFVVLHLKDLQEQIQIRSGSL